MSVKPQQEHYFRTWLVALLLWFGVIFLEYLGALTPIRNFGEWALLPAQQFVAKNVAQGIRPYLLLRVAYSEGNTVQALRNELSHTQARLAELKGIEAENKFLRELFRDTDRKWQETLLAAPVIGYGNPALAAGRQDQVQPGDAVMSFGTLLGRIGQVSEHQSEVLLLSNVSMPLILAKTEAGVTGVVRGTGQQILFTEVSRSSQVQNGELVVTLGQAGIPQNISLGTIRTQVSGEGEPVQSFQLNQPVTFYESAVLEVLPSGKP